MWLAVSAVVLSTAEKHCRAAIAHADDEKGRDLDENLICLIGGALGSTLGWYELHANSSCVMQTRKLAWLKHFFDWADLSLPAALGPVQGCLLPFTGL